MTSPGPQLIPATRGKATPLLKGQSIKIINTHGTQVIDTWAFSTQLSDSTMTPPATQYLSMQHTHASLNKLIPATGDTLTSNERKGMLTVVEDTTEEGIHDTVIAACDRWRYEELGAKGYHRNCADNLVEALTEIGVTPPSFTPSPLNLFMNIPWDSKGALSWKEPSSKAGQYIILRAEMDLVIAFSACPQDILNINCGKPVDAHFEIL